MLLLTRIKLRNIAACMIGMTKATISTADNATVREDNNTNTIAMTCYSIMQQDFHQVQNNKLFSTLIMPRSSANMTDKNLIIQATNGKHEMRSCCRH